MQSKLSEIKEQALGALKNATETKDLEEIRIKLLGKKGELTQLLRSMGSLAVEERPKVGQMVNELRSEIEQKMAEKETQLRAFEQEVKMQKEKIDVTLPGEKVKRGGLHPLNIVLNEMIDIFVGMGFELREGPEVEYDKYNFEMLNIPKGHPSRDMQDTFYINDNVVLRTQTSPVQVRTMISEDLPIRIISPGRVYRADEVDATHSPVFNQIEGLVIDKGITLADLKGVLDVFAKEMYGSETKTRFRASYFPFTEPSAEMDISCTVCGGKGCRVCKGTGWIEILGSGMVNENVLKMCGIDPKVYSGFAFGMGLDRITNLKYGITDIRLLYENDINFIKQFK